MQYTDSGCGQTPICDTTNLSEGGFTDDTEILTADGPRVISAIQPGDQVLALNPTTRLVKPKRVVDVETFDPPYGLVQIETNRADLTVAPDHRIPYTTKSISRPRFTRAENLTNREAYQFINEWQIESGSQLAQVDITDLVKRYEASATFEEHGIAVRAFLPDGCEPCRRNKTAYFFDPLTFKRFQNELEALAATTSIHARPDHWRRPYRFDGDDFLEFIGWFVTEGSVYWKKSRDSASIKIAQKTPEHREAIASLFDRMGIQPNRSNGGFVFGSKVFARLFERLCGEESAKKHLPEFIWDCSIEQKELLLRTLLKGDGTDFRIYSTSSDQLAHDVLRLMLELGYKPRYGRRRGMWKLFLSSIADGFKSSRNVSTTAVSRPMYRLAIEDFSVVMAGRNGKFQWTGVSAVN